MNFTSKKPFKKLIFFRIYNEIAKFFQEICHFFYKKTYNFVICGCKCASDAEIKIS